MKIISTFGLLVALSMMFGCGPGPTNAEKRAPNGEENPGTPSPAVQNWTTRETVNEMDGMKTSVFSTGDIYIRFRGNVLDVYINTPEMVGYDDTSVRVRFDEGKPVAQRWTRSEDYHALFAPDPRAFIAKLQVSKKLYFEYHPYEKVPDTLVFDVAGLRIPETLLQDYDKRVQKQRAASKRRFDACMADPENQRLWTDEESRRDYCKLY